MSEKTEIVLHKSVGFSFRVKSIIERKIKGEGRYDDTYTSHAELDGSGYDTIDEAIEALSLAKDRAVNEALSGMADQLERPDYRGFVSRIMELNAKGVHLLPSEMENIIQAYRIPPSVTAEEQESEPEEETEEVEE